MAAEPRLPRVALRPGSLGLLKAVASVLKVCCLCQLVPGATADWETVHCETKANSIPVAAARSAITDYLSHTTSYDVCCNSLGLNTCKDFTDTTVGTDSYALGVCSNILHCDNCFWVTRMWKEVLNKCAVNYNGVDRAGVYVAYDWSPGVWAHYKIWHS